MMLRFRFTLLLGLAVATHAAEAPLPREQAAYPGVTIDDLDANIKSFKSSVWQLPGLLGFPPPDHTGATVESDLAKYVLREGNLARLNLDYEAARRALPAGSNIVPESALLPMARMADAEACHMLMVNMYWRSRVAGAYHEDMIHKLLQSLPAGEQTSVLTRLGALAKDINALRTDLYSAIDACDGGPVPPLRNSEDPLTAYNSLRVEMLTKVLQAAAPAEPIWIKRSKACPAAATPGTTDAPRRLIASKSVADLYPTDAVAYQIEGLLRVKALFDSDGCVQEAAIVQTSGTDILDQAGIAYAFSLQFQPAIVNGKPVEDGVIAPINFSLLSFPGSTRRQPQP